MNCIRTGAHNATALDQFPVHSPNEQLPKVATLCNSAPCGRRRNICVAGQRAAPSRLPSRSPCSQTHTRQDFCPFCIQLGESLALSRAAWRTARCVRDLVNLQAIARVHLPSMHSTDTIPILQEQTTTNLGFKWYVRFAVNIRCAPAFLDGVSKYRAILHCWLQAVLEISMADRP